MKRLSFAMKYVTFAGVATCANIAAQWASFHALPSHLSLYGSILSGTAVGLLVKYLLDKRWIFRFLANSHAHEARTFLLYSVMGLLTTTIFWGSEVLFQHLFGSESMRYAGAILGLAIGYFIKYSLDKRFVFVQRKV